MTARTLVLAMIAQDICVALVYAWGRRLGAGRILGERGEYKQFYPMDKIMETNTHLHEAIDMIRFPAKHNLCANKLGWEICEVCNNIAHPAGEGCTKNELRERLRHIIEIASEAIKGNETL